MFTSPLPLTLLLISAALSGPAGAYENTPEPDTNSDQRRYTYSWLYADDDAMSPRGGTTRGPAVTLSRSPGDAWKALQEKGLDNMERDRRAILAMAGAYRTSFDFIETIGFNAAYTPDRPYQSWGTEYVYVVADQPGFISLQHILVMTFQQEDGSVSEPIVVKHWRHDWTHEDRSLQEYAGHLSWARRELSESEAAGTWSQAVYQVDDSPRYETFGSWVHKPGYSHWESELTWRPLPRREFSVRDDYHVLEGSMRISILPTGWVMEEDALKLVLTEDGSPRVQMPYLAREAGISRYERITGFDFSAGDAYWERTGRFWKVVRDHWAEVYANDATFALHKQVDEQPMFAAMFALADKHSGADADVDAMREDVEQTLARYRRD